MGLVSEGGAAAAGADRAQCAVSAGYRPGVSPLRAAALQRVAIGPSPYRAPGQTLSASVGTVRFISASRRAGTGLLPNRARQSPRPAM
ncbi:hypothetical protein GCM10010207_60910 [Streptomyces atratus]|nr:hypothetical protein GCM10010207_60910 [Streptomyces atratus]